MHHSSAHRPPRWKAQTSAPQLLRAQAHAAQLLRAPRRVVGQQAEREDADAPQHLRATRHHAPRGARALHRRPLHQLRAVLLRAAQRAEAALHLQLRIRLVPLPAVDQARRAHHPHHCPGKQIPQLSSESGSCARTLSGGAKWQGTLLLVRAQHACQTGRPAWASTLAATAAAVRL